MNYIFALFIFINVLFYEQTIDKYLLLWYYYSYSKQWRCKIYKYKFETVEDKAAEWNVTPRHVQYLCRTGKIKGAVKRAGSWFIPDDVPTPLKNTKSNAADFEFVGTKSNIFNSAIELFLLKGFDNVSLRTIAHKVGIQQSTLYNHFKSKQDILNTIYDFYCHHFLKERPSLECMKTKMETEEIMDIIRHIRYDFKEEHLQKMNDITRIVFQRIAIDERAREIGKSLMVDEGVKYVEDVFNLGIKNSRFIPFDTHIMAVFINAVRIFTLYNWIVDPSPDNMKKLALDENMLYKYAAKFIKDLKLPDKNKQNSIFQSVKEEEDCILWSE